MNKPYCTAPFHSILIDPDKTVKPCCIWDHTKPIGNLNTQSLSEILNGDYLKEVQQQMLKGEIPINCTHCAERENVTGVSPRLNEYSEKIVPYLNNNKITFLEFNSSNLCNLVCAACSPSWSSSWTEYVSDHSDMLKDFREINDTGKPTWKIHPPRTNFAINFFDNIDLSNLTRLTLKGGEPFLNKENILLLERLDSEKILPNIELSITTNGTFTSEKILNLANKTKRVFFGVSVDGVNELNQYIRFDPKNPEKSHTDNIKRNILTYAQLDNAAVQLLPTVQVHNIFKLQQLDNWWIDEIYSMNTNTIKPYHNFNHLLFGPKELRINVLSDSTRQTLINHYQSLKNSEIYNVVCDALSKPAVDIHTHNKFVNYTKVLDSTRLTTFLNLVPEAIDDMVYW